MRWRDQRGFTLVELMVATGLLVLLVFIAADLLPDVFSSRNIENLNDRVNRESQRTLAMLQGDIADAGFRFTPFSITDAANNTILALESPDVDHLRMRCVVGTCQLRNPAAMFDTTLTLDGFGNQGGNLIYTYEGRTEYLIVTAVNGDQVTIGPALSRALPAGTIFAEIALVEYQVLGTDLFRRVNGVERARVPIDPVGTSIRYVLDDPKSGPGATRTVQTFDDPVEDLRLLLYVNISLQMTRRGSVSRGKIINVTDTATQRITPLNLRTYSGG